VFKVEEDFPSFSIMQPVKEYLVFRYSQVKMFSLEIKNLNNQIDEIRMNNK